MGIFKKKSQFEKNRKLDRKKTRKKAKEVKKKARKVSHDEKTEARKASKHKKKIARQKARDANKQTRSETRKDKQEAKREKQEKLKQIRQSNLKGKDKRGAVREVKQKKRDLITDTNRFKSGNIKNVNQRKKDSLHEAKYEKKNRIKSANREKREVIQEANAKKRERLRSLKIPRAVNRRWISYLGFQEFRALEIFRPRTLLHLQSICRIATENNMEVRAVGSGHSFSEITCTEQILVQTHKMDQMIALGQAERRNRLKPEYHDEQRNNIVEFEVGRTVIDLSKELEKKGQALFNQGTYDGQTFWGAVSTSTHGSGIGRGPFPDMVVSVVLVGEGGRTYRIEPTEGITNPQGWKEDGIDEIIQNDDTFYTVICSMGCMGIVYSAIIKVRDFYWLNEWTYITTWDTFKSSFNSPAELRELLGDWDTFSILVAPSKAKRGKKDGVSFTDEYPCSLTFRKETNQHRVIGGRFFDALAKTLEDLHIITANKAPSDFFLLRPFILNSSLARSTVIYSGKHGWTGEELDPEALPVKRRNKCYKIFPKGGKLFGGYGIELSFPFEQTFAMMDKIIRLAEANAEDGLFHTAPVAVRFVAPSRAYASPQYDRETVMLEVLMAKGTLKGAEALAIIEEAMLGETDVRVHWGLNMDQMTFDNCNLDIMYPMWSRWMVIFRQFNQRGTFHNKFTRRLGL